jgi:hypothetical protein
MLIGIAGTVLAADPRFDDASAHVDQAVALLTAADIQDKKGEFGGHRVKAIELLKQAKKEIGKAKEFIDKHPPKEDAGAPPGKGGGPKPKPTTEPKPKPSK